MSGDRAAAAPQAPKAEPKKYEVGSLKAPSMPLQRESSDED